MEFIKAFEDIDKDFSGEITREELTEYMQQKNYKPAFVEKWLRIFDADNSGTITLDEFCGTLGLIPSVKHKENIQKRNAEKQVVKEEPTMSEINDVELIAQDPDVSTDLRDFSLTLCLESVKTFDDGLEISKHVKKHLDSAFHPCWHVVVGEDGYGCLVSHEAGGFIHVRARKWGILMWQVLSNK